MEVVWWQAVRDLVLVEDDIVAQALELIAHAACLTIPGTLNRIRGHAGFCAVLHPGHAVAMGIREAHPRPSREDDDQVVWHHLTVFVSIDDFEGLGEGQEMRVWIRRSDPAHAAQVFAAQNVAGDVPAKQTRLRRGDLRRNLCEIRIRTMLGEMLVPAPRLARAGIKPKRLKCVASLAQAWNAFLATLPGGRRDIHHSPELSVSFANTYQLLFHVLSSVPVRRPEAEARQTALLAVWVVWGGRTTKQKGGLRRPRVIWLSCWG